MNYATVVPELFGRFPKLEATYRADFAYMGDEEPGEYIVFGSILIPALATALQEGDLGTILPVCAFIEDVAVSAREDRRLEDLIGIEVGEWLGRVDNEALLTPWLGAETKRICHYVPGLATQRRSLREEQNERSVTTLISSWLRHPRKD